MSTYTIIKTEMAKLYAQMRDLASKIDTSERDLARSTANHELAKDEAAQATEEAKALVEADLVGLHAFAEAVATMRTLKAVAEGVGISRHKTSHMLNGMKQRQAELQERYDALKDSLVQADARVYDFKESK